MQTINHVQKLGHFSLASSAIVYLRGLQCVSMLDFIIWNLRPEIWPDGPLPLRWYGLFFAASFAFGQFIISYIFKRDGKPVQDVDYLTYYMIAGTVLGARLGHCLFYQPDYYLSNPLEILKIWEGGLASHGATVGILFSLWLYSRKRPDQSWLWILDRIVIVVALGGFFIRMGNLMNSEIVGKPSGLPWSVVFVQPFESSLRDYVEQQAGKDALAHLSAEKNQGENQLVLRMEFKQGLMDSLQAHVLVNQIIPGIIARSNGDEPHLKVPANPRLRYTPNGQNGNSVVETDLEGIPRHPAMVYEALSTLFLFVLLFSLWKSKPDLPEGRLFGIFVVILFSLRFFYEFLKENQVAFEEGLVLNMGQFLSIPLVIAGIIILFLPGRKSSAKKIVPDVE